MALRCCSLLVLVASICVSGNAQTVRSVDPTSTQESDSANGTSVQTAPSTPESVPDGDSFDASKAQTVLSVSPVSSGFIATDVQPVGSVSPRNTQSSTGTVNTPYSARLSERGGVPPYTYVVTSGSLPSGVSLNPRTGELTGIPDHEGTNGFNFSVIDSTGAIRRRHGLIVIGTPPISTRSLISMRVNPSDTSLLSGGTQQFTAMVQGTSNTKVDWLATAGSISSSGLFKAPTVSSGINVFITARSAANPSVHATAAILVSPPKSISLAVSPTSASIASGASQQFSATVQGTSNIGVSWHASSGKITSTGLYTAPVVSSNTRVTITAASIANPTATANATITISAPAVSNPPSSSSVSRLTITSPGTTSAVVGSAYSSTLTASAGTAPLSWNVSGGQLPAGLVLASNGNLSGKPTTAGTYTFTVRVLDSASPQQSAMAAITMVVSPTVSGCNSAPVISNLAYNLSTDKKSITITWDTNIPADTQVQWGDNDHTGGPNSGPADLTGKTTGHVYTITGLYPRRMYGFTARARCVDSNGPSLNTKNWGSSSFHFTPPLATGPFEWKQVTMGPHYTFAGYPLYFVVAPTEMQTSTGLGVSWKYTMSLTLPAGWTFTIDSCSAACPGFAVTGNSFTRTQYNGSTEEYLIHLHIPAGTAPGAYTVAEHTVDNTFGTAAQDTSWTVNILHPASDTVQQGIPSSYPPIPCQHANSLQANGVACPASWDSMVNLALSPASFVASGQICTDNSTLPFGYGSGYERLSWYYDGIRGYQQALEYTGNSAFNTCLSDALSYLRDRFYLYEPTLPSSTANWGAGHATFTRGLYADYQATGNPADLAAITNLMTKAPYSTPALELVLQNSQREVAFRLEAETVWSLLGNNDRTDLLNRTVALTIGSLDDACVSQNNSEGPLPSSIEPAFIGLAADSLIYYFDNGHQNDIRIPWAIKKCADWMWANAWIGQPIYAGGPDHYWDYLTDTRIKLGSDYDYRGLNGLVFPIYAWLFKYTGNATIPGSDGSQCYGTPGQPCTYQQAGDAAFSSAMATSGNLKSWGWLYFGKEYTQNTRWGFDYIKWRSGQ